MTPVSRTLRGFPLGSKPDIHSRLIEVHGAHGEELGQTESFRTVRRIQAELLRGVRPQSMLLIGPGHGDEAAAIFSVSGIDPDQVRLVAVDLSPARLERFCARFPRAEIHCGDVLDSQFLAGVRSRGRVDLVQMSFVLHDHTEADKPRLLEAIKLVLRPGGMLVAADPTLPNFPNYLPAVPDERALAEVKQGLRMYYQTYLDEIDSWSHLEPKRKAELIESLEKGLADALEHKDGREAFDTESLYRNRFTNAGFNVVGLRAAHNTIVVVQATVD